VERETEREQSTYASLARSFPSRLYFSPSQSEHSVGEIMTLDPVVVRGSETIESAARVLLARKVRRLPVVDGDGRLIGLFSRSDVMKVALEGRQAVLGQKE